MQLSLIFLSDNEEISDVTEEGAKETNPETSATGLCL